MANSAGSGFGEFPGVCIILSPLFDRGFLIKTKWVPYACCHGVIGM